MLLSATAKGQTNDYLSGIGEYQAAWSYYLSDGTNTVRQMTDAQGAVTLTRSFTPWGESQQLQLSIDFEKARTGKMNI